MYISAINTFNLLLKQVLASVSTIRQYQNYFDSLLSYMQLPQMKNTNLTNKEIDFTAIESYLTMFGLNILTLLTTP